MKPETDFLSQIEQVVRTQLSSQNVGYLLGAGSSHLNGKGYPLAFGLWDMIKDDIPLPERKDIQAKLDLEGTDGLEHALDLLDSGGPTAPPHRQLVTAAIAKQFSNITPPNEPHCSFLQRLSARNERFVPVFSLNYDPLIEVASTILKIPVCDGYVGFDRSFFFPEIFDHVPAFEAKEMRRKGVILHGKRGLLHLYKLHGSLGWYDVNGDAIRITTNHPLDENSSHLMIPPQYRKASDTTSQPYSALWTRYRAWLVQGARLLNRLACIGYGMRDEHVNDVIESATARGNFTLLIFAKSLDDSVFTKWSAKRNVVVVTNERCSMYCDIGPGHPNLWDFEILSKEV